MPKSPHERTTMGGMASRPTTDQAEASSSAETPAKKAHEPPTEPSPNTSASTQTLRSRLSSLGFKSEQDKTNPGHGTGIIGGVRKPKP